MLTALINAYGARFCAAALLLANFLPAFGSESLSAQATAERSTREGLLLLHKMQDAVGGVKRIAAVRDFDETIRAEAWDASGASLGEVHKRTRWIQSPTTLRLDQIGPRGTYVLYLDGRSGSGWEILPDLKSADRYKTTGAPIPLAGGELDFAKGYLSGFELNLWLADLRGYAVTSPRANVVRIEHTAAELAPHCLEDLDRDFVRKVRTGDLIVAGGTIFVGELDRVTAYDPATREIRFSETYTRQSPVCFKVQAFCNAETATYVREEIIRVAAELARERRRGLQPGLRTPQEHLSATHGGSSGVAAGRILPGQRAEHVRATQRVSRGARQAADHNGDLRLTCSRLRGSVHDRVPWLQRPFQGRGASGVRPAPVH